MAPLTALNTRKKSDKRLTRESEIFKTIIHAIQEKKGKNIISLDLRKIPEAVADIFVICEANSSTQIKAIAEYVEELVSRDISEKPYHHEGFTSLKWVLIDYVNVVVHVFNPETRGFYDLEGMWSDAQIMTHED